MIDQELYIELLELFDELKKMDIFITYVENKNKALNNIEVKSLIKQINELSDLTHTISYQPSLDEIIDKIEFLKTKLNDNTFYNNYIKSYNECNNYLIHISSIIFKDIVVVEREW